MRRNKLKCPVHPDLSLLLSDFRPSCLDCDLLLSPSCRTARSWRGWLSRTRTVNQRRIHSSPTLALDKSTHWSLYHVWYFATQMYFSCHSVSVFMLQWEEAQCLKWPFWVLFWACAIICRCYCDCNSTVQSCSNVPVHKWYLADTLCCHWLKLKKNRALWNNWPFSQHISGKHGKPSTRALAHEEQTWLGVMEDTWVFPTLVPLWNESIGYYFDSYWRDGAMMWCSWCNI